MASISALTSAANGAAQPLDIRVAQVDVGHAEQRRDRLFRRVAEIVRTTCARTSSRAVSVGLPIVYVSRPVFAVRDELLLAQMRRTDRTAEYVGGSAGRP